MSLETPRPTEVKLKDVWNKDFVDDEDGPYQAKSSQTHQHQKTTCKDSTAKADAKKRKESISKAQSLMQKMFEETEVLVEDIDDLVDSLPKEHADLLDKAEVKNGERICT